MKKLVEAGSFMVMKGRGLSLLVPPLTYKEAMSFVGGAVQMLTVDNFHTTVRLTYDVADVYGINSKAQVGTSSSASIGRYLKSS